jgi:hypothetical protein
MKIEKGKFYKSRNGQKWEVLTTERNDEYFSVITMCCDDGGLLIALHQNGMFYNDKSESDFDLIAEWTEPVEIPWSDYPTWCKWVAMDKDGEWYGFDYKPKEGLASWINSDFANNIHPDYHPRNFTGDWTESLFERP